MRQHAEIQQFWDLVSYSKIHTVNGVKTFQPFGIIELINESLAVSSGNSIIIIDTIKYEIKTEIKEINNWDYLLIKIEQ